MRYLILFVLALLLAVPAAAADLLITQSQRRPAYDQAVRLIQNSCGGNSETMVLSDYAEFDFGRIVREEQPRLVIVVGDQALKEARKLRSVPVVYAMALNVDENSLGENFTGVSMNSASENYLRLFSKLRLRRIGLIYDPRRSGAYLERARKAAAGSDIELIAFKVSSAREVPNALDRMKQSNVNGIWMLPDSTAVTPETIDAYFLFAQQQNLPVISFARSYLTKGALAVLEISRPKIGEQICSLVNKLQKGTPVKELGVVDVNGANLFTNQSVADRIGIRLSSPEHSPRADHDYQAGKAGLNLDISAGQPKHY